MNKLNDLGKLSFKTDLEDSAENKILRTTHGSNVNNNKYRVRLIKSWDNKNELIKPEINYGESLIFSSHLVHGLSLNEQNDVTRVALEFRLYEKLD